MVKTIGNPLTWIVQGVSGTGRAVGSATGAIGGAPAVPPRTRAIGMADIRAALGRGLADFARFRSDVIFLVLIYPIIGVAMSVLAFHRELMPMVFPMASGFLLLGPVAAIGLYEMSRRGEAGDTVGWGAALAVLNTRNIGPVMTMAAVLLGLFVLWMWAALQVWALTLGPEPPASVAAFLTAVFTTGAGWAMIAVGTGVGFVFAALVLAVSLVSLPMLIDQRVGVPVAVATSLRVTRENPFTVAAWGAIVAALMVLGSLPLFLGLIVVLPVLGHATWHLYRAAVAVDGAA